MKRFDFDLELVSLILSKYIISLSLLTVTVSFANMFPLLEVTIWFQNNKLYSFRFVFLFIFSVRWHKLTGVTLVFGHAY